MGSRSWFLDIVQVCVNYENTIKRMVEEMQKIQAVLKTRDETILAMKIKHDGKA